MIWVFCGSRAVFPSGVFSSIETAEQWILKHRLSGVLTAYPLDEGAYDWAVSRGFFTPKRPDQSSSEFVGTFTSIRQTHQHYEEGLRR
jgi:hypothetical protein